jgi:hypothetical protein
MPGLIPIDTITLFTASLSFLFTLLILSYVVGDNPAFRTAVHAFVGVSTGYVAIAVYRYVLIDKMVLPIVAGQNQLYWAALLVLSLPLLAKIFPATESFGRPWVAVLVGVGAAVLVGGAVTGTLLPQFGAATDMFNLSNRTSPSDTAIALLTGVFALIGTIATLTYFQFTIRGGSASAGKRGKIMNILALIGQVFISLALGVIFAGVLAASLTALVDRIQSLIFFSH